jgi:hypothetical protein
MTLFCFPTNKENTESIFKQVFKNVDVDFSIDDHDSCIILNKPNEKNLVLKKCEYLKSNYGFSNFKQLHRWTTIKHIGPYYSEYSHPFYNSYIVENNKKIPLSREHEEIAFLYVSYLTENNIIDSVFNNNFWNDFRKLIPGVSDSFTNINWDNIKKNYNLMLKEQNNFSYKEKLKHSVIEIDDIKFTCVPFVLDRYKVVLKGNDRGKIIRKIELSDVTINISENFVNTLPNKEKFKEIIYKKDVTWAAKWIEPVTLKKKYMSILFNTIEKYDDDDENEKVPNYDDDDSDTSIFGYDDETEEELNYSTDSENDDNAVIHDVRPFVKKVFNKTEKNDYYRGIDFDTLDDEYKLLPFNYIISVFEQWEIILKACTTQFTEVSHLNKVSDSLLQLVADAAMLAIKKNSYKNLRVNLAFIEYANKRNV